LFTLGQEYPDYPTKVLDQAWRQILKHNCSQKIVEKVVKKLKEKKEGDSSTVIPKDYREFLAGWKRLVYKVQKQENSNLPNILIDWKTGEPNDRVRRK